MNDNAISTIQQPGHGRMVSVMGCRKPLIWADMEEDNEMEQYKQLYDDISFLQAVMCIQYKNCFKGCPFYYGDIECRFSTVLRSLERLMSKEKEVLENNNTVHHPKHYNWKGIECDQIIEWMAKGLEGKRAFYMGSIMKYLYRYPYKGNPQEDLMKAEEYIRLLRESYESDTKGDDK